MEHVYNNGKIKRICLYGGAGCGKSTLAAGLFYEMKKHGFNVEYVPEYIKDWAYEGRIPKSFQQLYIFAKQLNREDVLFPHVSTIITDSPLLMNTVYSKKYNFVGWRQLVAMADLFEEKYPGLHIFLNRGDMGYRTEGRYEDIDGAKSMDAMIKEVLSENYAYTEFDSRDFEKIKQHVFKAMTD